MVVKLSYPNWHGIDIEISHEEFITIFNEKDKYEKMKQNVTSVNEKNENMRSNSVNLGS